MKRVHNAAPARPLSIAACVIALFVAGVGCGSQQLRLTAPETSAGVSYTCTSANTCYPASMAAPVEGQADEAIPLVMPRECQGQIHEIVIREADSSEPEIDVTCATPKAGEPAGQKPAAAPSAAASEPAPVDASAIEPIDPPE
jgi:hypothetical protein